MESTGTAVGSTPTSTDSSDAKVQLASKSQPIGLLQFSTTDLKHQTSAPSYLFSLKDSDSPPFRKPCREPKPKILIGTFLTVEEAVDMITAGVEEGGLERFLIKQLLAKNVILNYELPERKFLLSLLSEAISYCAQHRFDEHKLACLLSIYINTHLCFKRYYWLPPTDVWEYFKEVIIRHTIEDSPDGEEVFAPAEAYDILTHFHTIYMNNLPLIHIIVFGAHRIKFTWPFKK